jgi:hypothetical protein
VPLGRIGDAIGDVTERSDLHLELRREALATKLPDNLAQTRFPCHMVEPTVCTTTARSGPQAGYVDEHDASRRLPRQPLRQWQGAFRFWTVEGDDDRLH